jgi:hypothetical protein
MKIKDMAIKELANKIFSHTDSIKTLQDILSILEVSISSEEDQKKIDKAIKDLKDRKMIHVTESGTIVNKLWRVF